MTLPLFIIDNGRTFVVRGNAWPALTGADIKPLYVGGRAMGFVVDRKFRGTDRLADFCAYLDARGIPYRIKRGDT